MALNLTDSSIGIGLYRETVTGIISAVAVAAGIATAAGTGIGITATVGSASGTAAASGVSSGTISTGAGSSLGIASVTGGGQNNFTRLNIGIWPDFGFTSQLTRSWTVATTVQLGADIGAFGDVEIQIDLEVRPILNATGAKVLNAVTGTSAGTSIVRGYSGSKASASGIATVSGVGATAGTVFGNAPGISAGSSTASAVGALASIGVGSSSGTSTATAIGYQESGIGFAAGTSTANAPTSTIIIGGAGTASGTSVAQAAPYLALPNVVGLPVALAILAIQTRPLIVKVIYRYDDTVLAGRVIRQFPSGGSDALDGSTVTIYVSRGRFGSQSDYSTMTDYAVDDCNRRIDYEKDPDDTRNFLQNFVVDLDGDTISSVTFLLPDGLTEVSSSNTATAATIFVSGGSAGSTYRITYRVATVGRRTFDRTIRVRVRER